MNTKTKIQVKEGGEHEHKSIKMKMTTQRWRWIWAWQWRRYKACIILLSLYCHHTNKTTLIFINRVHGNECFNIQNEQTKQVLQFHFIQTDPHSNHDKIHFHVKLDYFRCNCNVSISSFQIHFECFSIQYEQTQQALQSHFILTEPLDHHKKFIFMLN